MTDDITFCGSECDNTKCRRHRSNIKEPQYPHSVALLEGTEYCEKKPTSKPVRLIDANALRERVNRTIDYAVDEFDKGYNIGIQKAVDLIDNAPTINKCDNCDLMFKEKTKKGGITE